MAFREVPVFEVREILRLWLGGEELRSISRLVSLDRKTVRRYVETSVELGLDRDGGEDQLTDVFVGEVVERVRPHRTDGHGEAWRRLDAHRDQLNKWLVNDELTVVKTHELLERQGVVVPQRTLHRYALDELGVGQSARSSTVRIVDGNPGDELQVDFGKLGRIPDLDTGRRCDHAARREAVVANSRVSPTKPPWSATEFGSSRLRPFSVASNRSTVAILDQIRA